ncbi:MAG TPA: type II secretion system F family protein [Bryobacteraceae bacterium]|nr:type II secretion system F family protein [Bryobacteraceae bacterium]
MNELGILISFFVVVLACITGVGYLFLKRSGGTSAGVTASLDAPPVDSFRESLKNLGALVPKRSQHVDHYRQLLSHAGYRHPDALTTFFGIKAASILVAVCLLALVSLIASGDTTGVILAMIAGAGIGHLAPDRILRATHARRDRYLRGSLPIALELMILGLEAGQGLDTVVSETARELDESHPELAEELNLVLMEMLASRSRQEALRGLIERNTEPEIKRIGQVLIDGDRFGSGLAVALRNQLRFLRTRMRQSAQEQARKVSVKLVFPIFFLIFPAILLVTLGPAVILVFNALTKMLAL